MQVESHLSHASLGVRKLARGLAVFLLAYSTAYMETLTIAHVSLSCQATASPPVRVLFGVIAAAYELFDVGSAQLA